MTKTALVYGNSLYELAVEEKLEDRILEEITETDKIFKENPEYKILLKEPSLPKKKRLDLISEAFEGKVHEYVLNFIKVLLENNELDQLNGSAQAFKDRYNKEHGITVAVVTSATKLSESQITLLKEKLEKISNRKIVIEEKVDSKYIAGISVEMDGVRYDGTALGRLNAIRKKVNDITL